MRISTASYWRAALVASLVVGLASRALEAGFTVTEAAGPQTSSIQGAVDNFRGALGTLNPNNGSAFSSGRREINWDGVPDNLSDPDLFPGDFFNQSTPGGRARGANFSTDGTGFMVTADDSNLSGAAPSLGFPADFRPFSQQRLFTPIGSLITDVTFFVPGSPTTPAAVSAFGAVFSDVELANITKIELFSPDDTLLFSRDVLSEPASGGFSFLGLQANAGERIGRVRITTGDIVVLGNNNFGPGSDTVLLDDFLYSEPIAVPEPSTALLLAVGTAALAWRACRNKRCQEPFLS